MRSIVVDDEIYMLETLQEAVRASFDIERVDAFSSCSAALAHAAEHPVDIAFLDINMRGIGGLGLAEKLMEMHPHCKIVFCTGYEEYAVSAFRLHVSGYLMKPITAEAVQKEIDHIKGVKAGEKMSTLFRDCTYPGMTIAASGFYGPQGRVLRMPLAMPDMLDTFESFSFNGMKVTNFEMEGSAIAGIAAHLGHNAGTVCCIIAHRHHKASNPDYKPQVRKLIELCLDKLAE